MSLITIDQFDAWCEKYPEMRQFYTFESQSRYDDPDIMYAFGGWDNFELDWETHS